VNVQFPYSRTRPRLPGCAARWGRRVALAALLGPTVAAAQGVGTVTVPSPLSGETPPGPRVIAPVPGGTIPPPQPPPPPTFPTVIPLEPMPAPVPPGTERARVINLVPDSTGLLPDRPPGPPVPRPATEVGKQVGDLIELVQDPEAELSLVIGHNKLLETRRPLTRIAISNPRVADVELLTDQPNTRLLNVYGRSFGTTTLTLWDAENKPLSFLLRVTIDAKNLESRLNQAFPGARLYVRQVASQIILEGQVPDNKTMADVLQVVQQEVRVSGQASVGGLGTAIPGGGGAGAPGAGAGQNVSISTPTQFPAGVATPSNLQPGLTIINRVHVPGPRQILLKVKIALLDRDAIRQLGVSWLNPQHSNILASTIGAAAGITGTAGPLTQSSSALKGVIQPVASTFNASATAVNSPTATLFGIFHAAHFSLFLDALRSNALAKILAEPNLMTLDGQPAQFVSGGLFPFPVAQSSALPGGTAVVTVQFQQFGTILTFLPHIMPNDVIRLDVEPIFSALNKAEGTTISGGAAPAIDQRRARTVVELREGQTLAIAGLLQTTQNATTIRIPGLGDLPIVGPWFSMNTTETHESELVVLVTPELVAPMESNEVPDAPGDRVLEPNDWEFYFLGRIEGKTGQNFRATVREMDTLNIMRHFHSTNRWLVGPHGYAE
jgi:pilus assembly protein CpaC